MLRVLVSQLNLNCEALTNMMYSYIGNVIEVTEVWIEKT
jgi:hypothetical protein